MNWDLTQSKAERTAQSKMSRVDTKMLQRQVNLRERIACYHRSIIKSNKLMSKLSLKFQSKNFWAHRTAKLKSTNRTLFQCHSATAFINLIRRRKMIIRGLQERERTLKTCFKTSQMTLKTRLLTRSLKNRFVHIERNARAASTDVSRLNAARHISNAGLRSTWERSLETHGLPMSIGRRRPALD